MSRLFYCLKVLISFLKKHKFTLLVLLLYLGVTLYYLWPMPLHCSGGTISMGDANAGPIWRNSVSSGSPLWGFTDVSNYPDGEQLNVPINYSGILQYSWYWIFAKLAGPVCGYNLVNAIGFISSAFVMYLFIKRFMHSQWLGVLAGYLVSFSPYFQVKVGDHPSYGYQFLIIAFLWALIEFLGKFKFKSGLILSLITAACLYWDPYFSLYVLVIGGFLVMGWVVFELLNRKSSTAKYILLVTKKLGIVALSVAMLIMPLIYIRLHYSNEINNYLGESRNPILFDAQIFSNRPIEYLMPVETNPFLRPFLGKDYGAQVRHWSNPAEYTVGLSLVGVLVVITGLICMAWSQLTGLVVWPQQLYSAVEKPRRFFIALGTVLVGAYLLSMPPIYGPIKWPSFYLLQVFDMWRALSRLYVVINIVFVVFFMFSLLFLSSIIRTEKVKRISYALLVLFIFIEYQAYAVVNRPVFKYKFNYPIMKDLSQINELNEVAEYPLAEYPHPLQQIYLVNQFIHQKKILNSALPHNGEILRSSLADITDPQTLPALRTLGIDAIILHGDYLKQSIPSGLVEINYYHMPETPDGFDYYPIRLMKITPGKLTDRLVVIDQGVIDKSSETVLNPMNSQIEVKNISRLGIYGLDNGGMGSVVGGKACFSISYVGEDVGTVLFSDGDKPLGSAMLGIKPNHFSFNVSSGIIHINITGKGKIYIHDLGCASP